MRTSLPCAPFTRRRTVVALTTLAFAAIAGCGDGPSEPRGLPLDWPLDVGARWTYSVQYVSTKDGLVFDRVEEVRVVRDTTAYGRRWVYVEGIDLVTSLLGRWFATGRDGIVAAWTLEPSPNFPGTIPSVLAWPAPGVRTDARFHGTRRLTRPDSTVTVPAGTFTCLRYRETDVPDDLSVECIAPGVGLVAARRLSSYSVDGTTMQPTGDSTFYVVRLTSYAPAR